MGPPQQPLDVRENVIVPGREVGEGEGAVIAAAYAPSAVGRDEPAQFVLQRRHGRVAVAHMVEVFLHVRRGRGRDRDDVGIKTGAGSGITGSPRSKGRASRDAPAIMARQNRHAGLGIAHGLRRATQESAQETKQAPRPQAARQVFMGFAGFCGGLRRKMLHGPQTEGFQPVRFDPVATTGSMFTRLPASPP